MILNCYCSVAGWDFSRKKKDFLLWRQMRFYNNSIFSLSGCKKINSLFIWDLININFLISILFLDGFLKFFFELSWHVKIQISPVKFLFKNVIMTCRICCQKEFIEKGFFDTDICKKKLCGKIFLNLKTDIELICKRFSSHEGTTEIEKVLKVPKSKSRFFTPEYPNLD